MPKYIFNKIKIKVMNLFCKWIFRPCSGANLSVKTNHSIFEVIGIELTLQETVERVEAVSKKNWYYRFAMVVPIS